MKSERARAKTLIFKWFDEGRPSAALRRRFSADVDRFFDEILKREDWAECLTTLLDDAQSPPISARGGTWQSQPTKRGSAVSSIVPGWAFGWRQLLKDE